MAGSRGFAAGGRHPLADASARACGPRLGDTRHVPPAERAAAIMHRRGTPDKTRSEEHTSELQSLTNLVCRLLLEKKKKKDKNIVSQIKSNRTICSSFKYNE